MGDITKNFSEWEFRCRCCGNGKVKKELVEKLQKVRNKIGIPITVNSGYRCLLHNIAVGSSDSSSHRTGMAADISCRDMFVLLRAVMNVFNRVGIGGEYLHVDIDEEKDQGVYWLYARDD